MTITVFKRRLTCRHQYLFNMKKSIFFGLFSLACLMVFSACTDDDDLENENNKVEKIDDATGFQNIEVVFQGSKFGSADEKALLEELKICSEDSEIIKTSEVPPCSPENFKVMPLHKDMSLKNGFMVLIKAETAGFPLRRLLVFQRERGELVKANGFVANLIGRIPTESGFDDLVLRFWDKDEAGFKIWYNCLFTWKDGKYEYNYVETIEGPNWGGKVKLADRENYSKSVYETIVSKKMLF